jgi:SAM-dependent methyltransferase
MKSYSAQSRFVDFFKESICLYQSHRASADDRVAIHIRTLKTVEALVKSHFGVKLEGMNVLDIGVGQFPFQLLFFAQKNNVMGIDFDVVPLGFSPFTYIQMLRFNGFHRTLKTLGRKVLGVDSRYKAQMVKQLGLNRFPRIHILRMDACHMTFPPKSFDFIHSRSVFHHLADPKAALENILNVLKPGGILYLSFHLFTSENGSLDPRIFTERSKEVGLWPHLRPSCAGTYSSNAVVNRLRLREWRALFDDFMPGAIFMQNRSSRMDAESDISRLKNAGELIDYSNEELLTNEIIVLWRKSQS